MTGTFLLFIIIILLLSAIVNIRRKVKVTHSFIKSTLYVYGSIILLLSLLSFSFVYPKMISHDSQLQTDVETVEYWDISDLSEDYKVDEIKAELKGDEMKVQLEDYQYTFLTVYVKEEERDDILIETYQFPSTFSGIDMTEKLPKKELEVEDDTLLIKEEKSDPLKESYYRLQNDLVTNQFAETKETNTDVELHYNDGDYVVLMHIPVGTKVADEDEVIILDE